MDDTITLNSDSRISSNDNDAKSKRNLIANFDDVGYHMVKRAKSSRGYYILEFYETPSKLDSRIRNAVTGIWYHDDYPTCKYILGSRQEDLFFKVRVSTGDKEMGNGDNRKNSYLLFYDSPEQFERHQKTTLNQETKEKWQEKNMLCRLKNKRLFSKE